MAYQGDLDLDVASPVAGRSSNASADRQAVATLAKKLKAQQAEISSLHRDKRALQVGDMRCMHGCTHCMPVRMGVCGKYVRTSIQRAHTHARMHACMHACTHTHPCTHMRRACAACAVQKYTIHIPVYEADVRHLCYLTPCMRLQTVCETPPPRAEAVDRI